MQLMLLRILEHPTVTPRALPPGTVRTGAPGRLYLSLWNLYMAIFPDARGMFQLSGPLIASTRRVRTVGARRLSLQLDTLRQSILLTVPPHCNYTRPGGKNPYYMYWQVLSLSNHSVQTSQFDEKDLVMPGSVMKTDPDLALRSPDALGALSSLRFNITYPFTSSWASNGTVYRPTITYRELAMCAKTYAASRFAGGKLFDAPTESANLRVRTPASSSSSTDGAFPAWPCGTGTPSDAAFNSSRDPGLSDQIYWLNGALIHALQNAFADTFRIEITQKDVLYGDISTLVSTTYALNGGNLSQTFGSVATALTNQIRRNQYSKTVMGTSMAPVTHVAVNWPWLTYSAALSILGAVFLVICIVFFEERERYVWKSSVTALLSMDCMVGLVKMSISPASGTLMK